MGGYHSLPELRTAQPEDPLTALAKVAQVRAAMQQAAMAPGQMELQRQEIEAGQQQATVRAQAIADNKAMTQAWLTWDGKNPDDLSRSVLQNGGSANAAAQAQKHLLDIKDTSSQIAERLANASEKEVSAYKQKQDMLNGALSGAAGADDQSLSTAITQTAQGLRKNNIIGDDELQKAQQLAQMAAQDPASARAQLQGFIKTHQTLTQQTEQTLNDLKAKTAAAELPGKVAESTIKTQDAALSPAARALKNQSALEYYAGQDDPAAKAALAEKIRVAQASRPVNVMGGMGGPSNAKDIANSIIKGDQPPDLSGLGRGDTGLVRGELARQGYNLVAATTDWKAVQKQIATLNGPQQTRLRQSIQAAGDMLDKVESLYDQWQKLAPQSGYKVLNKATLAAMKQMPGQPGAIAQALDAQIADLTSDLGNIYMGGNSPTDHSLALAQKSLSADWNDASFREGLTQARANVKIRYNSILNTEAAGTGGNSQYMPKPQPEQKPAGGFDWSAHPIVK